MRIAIILGLDPKSSSAHLLSENANVQDWIFILHTGQHYSYLMDKVFFEQLDLPLADYNLDVGSGSHGKQTGLMLEGIEKVLLSECPDVVLVQGDTNTVLAGAIAASKLGVKVGHVEAGLRSYDRCMPEEVNRVLADHCSDFLFVPTECSRNILLGEGIDSEKIFVVGNTVVDAVYQNLELAKSKLDLMDLLGLEANRFMLATVHRAENVDDKTRFSGVIDGLRRVQSEFGVPLVYPIHPRAKKQLQVFGLDTSGLTLVDPLDYLGFLLLESSAMLVLSDSGGVQEEACVLGVPCVTLRDNTERPETLDVGSNVLAGTYPSKILSASKVSVNKKRGWVNPFGDGYSAQKSWIY